MYVSLVHQTLLISIRVFLSKNDWIGQNNFKKTFKLIKRNQPVFNLIMQRHQIEPCPCPSNKKGQCSICGKCCGKLFICFDVDKRIKTCDCDAWVHDSFFQKSLQKNQNSYHNLVLSDSMGDMSSCCCEKCEGIAIYQQDLKNQFKSCSEMSGCCRIGFIILLILILVTLGGFGVSLYYLIITKQLNGLVVHIVFSVLLTILFVWIEHNLITARFFRPKK